MPASLRTKTALVALGLTGVLLLTVVVSLLVGTTDLSFRWLLDPSLEGEQKRRAFLVLMSYRVPRVLLACITGAGLATAGVVFQGVLRNPLADPYIVGISAGGALGAVLAIVAIGGDRILGTSLSAFIGSLLAVAIVYGLAQARRGGNYVETVILAGVIVGSLMNALMMLVVSVSGSNELQRILYWLMGDFSLADYRKVTVAGALVLVGWVFLYSRANALNVLLTGDESARTLGLEVGTGRVLLMAVAALITGAVVSVAGTVGFVGLVVPHGMRLLFGPDHRVLMPAALLGGAAFLAAADCLARVAAYPVELPVGVITALTGAPFFLYLLLRR